jgi:4-aminobutyrate aminotransferase/(S)-3-amino-2-methylpropionate transaminase
LLPNVISFDRFTLAFTTENGFPLAFKHAYQAFRWVHKIDIPAFPWPVAPFPSLKYPLKDFEKENAAEEQRCLAAVEHIFASRANNADAVAGCIVEPILAEGGDKSASHEFFRKLRALCSK